MPSKRTSRRPHQPSDGLSRAFSQDDPKRVAALIRSRLPRRARRLLARATFHVIDPDFFDERIGKHFADRLVRIRLRDGRDLLAVVEFKSRRDPGTLEQLARYRRLLLQRYAELYPQRPRPAILPLVVYTGAPPWREGCVASTEAQVMELLGADPGLRYLLLDAQREDLSRTVADAATRAVLRTLVWRKSGTAQELRRIFRGVRAKSLLEAQIHHFLLECREVSEELMEEGCYTIRPHLKKEAKMTLANKWRAEARVKTLQTVLLKQLEKISGPLSADARQRIDAASPKQLESWALAVPTAVQDGQSADDVLNGATR